MYNELIGELINLRFFFIKNDKTPNGKINQKYLHSHAKIIFRFSYAYHNYPIGVAKVSNLLHLISV